MEQKPRNSKGAIAILVVGGFLLLSTIMDIAGTPLGVPSSQRNHFLAPWQEITLSLVILGGGLVSLLWAKLRK